MRCSQIDGEIASRKAEIKEKMRKVWYGLWQDFANIVGEAYRMEKYVNAGIMVWAME